MQDRISRYPGRVKLTNPVTGESEIRDMEMADEPTAEGTPLNKATLLSDPTAQLYGLVKPETLGDAPVGYTVTLKVNGVLTDFIIVHHGLPSSMYDESCNGTWLLMKDCYEKRQWHSSNVNDYANSTIHSYLNSTFLNLFDDEIKSQIKQVKVPYRPGSGTSTTINSGANGLSAKIFLLSGYEVGFTTSVNQSFPVDGAKLDYFDSGTGTTANNKRIGYLNGSATGWRLRSPRTDGAASAWSVLASGDFASGVCSSLYGVRPALVLPASLYIWQDGTPHDAPDPSGPTPDDAFRAAFDVLPTIYFDGVYTEAPPNRSTPTALSQGRYSLAGASVGNYALFAGGYGGSSSSAVADAYNTSLTRTTPTALTQARYSLAGASVGNHALFAGGIGGNTAVGAYSTSLTRTTQTALSQGRYNLAGASVGNYALFAGGNSGSASAVVDAYNTSLTRTTPTALSQGRYSLAGASVGNYALFAGGSTGSNSAVVDAYNTSLTRTTPTALSVARYSLAGASVGNYALFAGGTGSASAVDAYNTSLTRTTPTALSAARTQLAGASVGNYALFAGGNSGSASAVVDAYNTSLTRTTPTALSQGRYSLAGASVGNYALFAGGDSGSASAVVDAYTGDYGVDLTIPALSKYKFEGFHATEQFTKEEVEWSSIGRLTGYIKRSGFTLSGKI